MQLMKGETLYHLDVPGKAVSSILSPWNNSAMLKHLSREVKDLINFLHKKGCPFFLAQ